MYFEVRSGKNTDNPHGGDGRNRRPGVQMPLAGRRNRTEKVVRKAFSGSRRFDVYIASSYLKEKEEGNIHIAERWDFNELLDEAALFINHGGQNSIVDGLIHGVPQIMVPGKVFERKYNAGAVADNNAGTLIMSQEFEPKHLRATAKKLILSKEARKNASRLGEKLLSEGGIEQVIHELLWRETSYE